jgi:hypothetical protein
VAKDRKPDKPIEEVIVLRPPRVKLTRQECLKRIENFPKRSAKFIASIRRAKHRSVWD